MTCRIEDLGFDIAATAGWFSAIAGLLAGFALLAILFPLDHTADKVEDDSAGESVVIFACAFFTLLILAFNFAVLSGRSAKGAGAGIAAHEQLLNGAVFVLASLLILFGLRSVLDAYGRNARVFAPARGVMLQATSVLGPIVVLALAFENALGVELVRLAQAGPADGSCGLGGIPTGVWINLGITVVGIVAVLALGLIHDRLPRRLSAARVVAKGVLIASVVVTVWTAVVVPLLSVEVVASAIFEHAVLVATVIATVIVAAAARVSH